MEHAALILTSVQIDYTIAIDSIGKSGHRCSWSLLRLTTGNIIGSLLFFFIFSIPIQSLLQHFW